MAKEPTKKTAPKAVKKATVKKAAVKKAAVPQAAAPKAATAKKAVAPKAAAPKAVAPAAAPKAAAPAAPVKKAAVKKAPAAKKPVKTKASPLTTIVAKVDVGFGNTLYLRGAGANLSWDKGVLMGCANEDEWVWSSDAVTDTVEFKVLINDEIWAYGANAFVARGERIVLEPAF